VSDTSLNIDIRRLEPPQRTVVTVAGDVDYATSRELDEALAGQLQQGRTELILDLGDVSTIDSSGLGLLVRFHQRTRKRNGWLRLVRVRAQVRRALQITNLERILGVYDTLQDAFADIRTKSGANPDD
jgi:anti-sigma B factor antagonist